MTELNGVTTEEEGVMRFFQLISVAVIGLTSQVTASVTPSEYYYSVSKSLFEIPDEITTDQGTFSHFSIRCVFGRNYDASELLETLKSKESELYPYLSSIDEPKRIQIARSVKLELGSLSTSYTYESSGDPLFLSGMSEPFFRMDNLRPSPDTRWVSFILSGSVQKRKSRQEPSSPPIRFRSCPWKMIISIFISNRSAYLRNLKAHTSLQTSTISTIP